MTEIIFSLLVVLCWFSIYMNYKREEKEHKREIERIRELMLAIKSENLSDYSTSLPTIGWVEDKEQEEQDEYEDPFNADPKKFLEAIKNGK